MDRIKGLSTGSKIVLGCGMLLFFSLFFTWQNLQVDFGPRGHRHADARRLGLLGAADRRS